MIVRIYVVTNKFRRLIIKMRKSKVGYIILAIIFGIFGIHNFYAGHNERALAQLLTTVLAGWLVFPVMGVLIWVLIDICIIGCDSKGREFV